ncbi:efflux RND transporter periplasmic adaptor subunit [uncultured Aquabacterium sp.]|uniref:efflux RND transporter periplasmic adaptor subunit n=2 Tax=Pseudomonadota TaxID=1224 RepID=UPI0025E879B1|nr:efflux RND transporter periplasmic adaptor subunit [uncultured Aquabacterium sp.]
MSVVRRPAWRRHVVWIVLAALALGGLGWVKLRPVAVDAVPVQARDLVRTLQFTGRVKTPARVEVGVTLTGRVAEVRVDEGDAVRAGQPLILLEPDEARAAVAQARASLTQAEARLGSQQTLALANAEAALGQAEATLRAAERDLARTQALVAQQFFSQSRLDEARRATEVARAQRDAARAQVQANEGRGAERSAAQAQVATAQAALQVAQARLDQLVVRAPGPGRVLLRQVEPGQIVQAGKGLLTLAVQGPLELVAQVDERFLGQLQADQVARVLADAYPDAPFEARLARLAPSVDAQSGAVEVTFVVPSQAPSFLREDMTLSIEVGTGTRKSARAVPLKALREPAAGSSGERATVLVAESGRAAVREVTLGLRTLDAAEVRSGLNEGDLVLLDATLAPGTRVRTRVQPAGAAPSPAAR